MALRYNDGKIGLDDTVVVDIQFEDDQQSSLPMGDFGYFFWGWKALYNEIQNYDGRMVYKEVDLYLNEGWYDYEVFSDEFIVNLVRSGTLRHLRQNWEIISHEKIPNEPLIIYLSTESPVRIRVVSKAGGTLPPIICHPKRSAEDESPLEEDITEQPLHGLEGVESLESVDEYYLEEWVPHIKFRPVQFQPMFRNLVNLVMGEGIEDE
ncbi:hypothetical protein [Halobiforma nitratireducens]|nr:hypothetical protein [Halobiforma nitratireducens]